MPWKILPNPHNTKLARELARRDSVAAPNAPERRDVVHERLVSTAEYQAGYRAGERRDYSNWTFTQVRERYGKRFAEGWNAAWTGK
jgi:hypothetical protein